MSEHLQVEKSETFVNRHIGPSQAEVDEMLSATGFSSLDDLMDAVVPTAIRTKAIPDLPYIQPEQAILAELRSHADQNTIALNFIGQGYHGCYLPSVIRRNVLENPGWYTQYTPYQAEISQGRLEALLNFQTMISDLTGLPVSNASLLDEATAAAEAMLLAFNSRKSAEQNIFLVSRACHPQTIDVLKTRAQPLGIGIEIQDLAQAKFDSKYLACLVQYPQTDGAVNVPRRLISEFNGNKTPVIFAADILALVTLKAPSELGADIVVGSSQRFGVPMMFGGPHAAFFATKDEYKRKIPGRIVGVSKDKDGAQALRLALQTREQHIRREKATSNICTAQVLLAILSSMYAVYHGPTGLRRISRRVHQLAIAFAEGVRKIGGKVVHDSFYDTVLVELKGALPTEFNFRRYPGSDQISFSFDETHSFETIDHVLNALNGGKPTGFKARELFPLSENIDTDDLRVGEILTHPVFSSHRSETELQRYIRSLEAKDLSLTRSMIPLGSCTMKLNAASELYPVSWPEFSDIHPFAPPSQTKGYQAMIQELENYLCEVTGFDATSLQPNAGSQGEYAGLLAIKRFHEANGDQGRNICLIPQSAHGTNPASAVMAGMKVVIVSCDQNGNVDLEDLRKKASEHRESLAALMITYPSTHGVFEEGIKEICRTVHDNGGQVYMDGANMNAQIGFCRPPEFGADVCHLNLHKTFAIPHGGGGPGIGPISVKAHLKKYLPGHFILSDEAQNQAVSAAPWGSAGILPISWMYIRLLSVEGLKRATQIAVLNANYIVSRLGDTYPVLYKSAEGHVAHECIIDFRKIKAETGIDVEDVAKRLMDYGFHAPTISFPVMGTMMIEPTESEDKRELDRFCDAMISIRDEIREIESKKADSKNNILKNAPHTAFQLAGNWEYPYEREKAVFPTYQTKANKYWPPVARIDNVFGDRNLVCACPPIDDYQN